MRVNTNRLGSPSSSIPSTLYQPTAQCRPTNSVAVPMFSGGIELQVPTFPLLLLIVLIMLTASSTSAQNSNHMGIPAESKPGQSTASSYVRDKIETVNLANGNFSLSIPLATVGGRGS